MGRRINKRYLHHRNHRRLWRWLFCLAGAVLVPVIALAAYVLSRDAWRALSEEKLRFETLSLQVYDREDRVCSILGPGENRLLVDVEELPEHVKQAFISAEDARFYEHPGVDVIRVLGAAWSDIKAGSFVEGASTITQQLIKLTHLTSKKELSRKVDEAILSLLLEKRFTKDQILELYLNTVYFGGGYYGLETAAHGYFGISAKELSLAQAALLAGVLKSPSRFAPHLRPEASLGRRGVILDLMAEYGCITTAQAQAAKAEPLSLNRDPALEKRGYYVDYALQQACDLLGVSMDQLLSEGYHLYTAMDQRANGLCEDLFLEDDLFPEVNGEHAQGAIFLMDAQQGQVIALVGGRDQTVALGYNRAVRIRRQPGSVIKPILVYAPALEAGYTAADVLLDEAATFGDYAPSDASKRYSGWVTMREAVTRSLNIPAVELFDRLGIGRCKSFARNLGIPFDKNDTRLALALGGFTYGVSPKDLCAAYAAFAAGGVYRAPVVVRRITDREGKTVYEASPAARRVMSEGNAFILTSMLQSVATEGTAKVLGELDMEVAAKTGTVGDATGNRDVWLAAYTRDYAAVIWMGFDQSGGGRLLPPDSGGGDYPAGLMKRVLEGLYLGKQAPTFTQPSSVISVRLDGYTMQERHEAVLATAFTPERYDLWEYFVRGTEPRQESTYWAEPEPPQDLQLSRVGTQVTLTFTPPTSYARYLLYKQDSNGYSRLLFTFEGDEAPRYTDSVALDRGFISYYVVPLHPMILINGSPLAGPASKAVSTTVLLEGLAENEANPATEADNSTDSA